MIIQYNLVAMNAGRNLGLTDKLKGKSVQKLSSGYKINIAADDAAGLSISEKTRKMIRGLDQASDNIEDGISLCQVADGALTEVHDMLHRLTELSVQSANGTNSDSDRMALQNEVTEILKEVDRIGDTTKFNDIYIFHGNPREVEVIDDDYLIRQVPFSDWSLNAYTLGDSPFGISESQRSDPGYLCLKAVVSNSNSELHGKNYNLVYGNGSTSTSSIKIEYGNTKKVINLKNSGQDHFTYVPNSYQQTSPTSWTRQFTYRNDDGIDLTLTQNVEIDSTRSTANELYYKMDYDISSNSIGRSFSGFFQFHCDTAYNNQDYVEGYYMDGNRITENSVWRTGGTVAALFPSTFNSNYIHGFMDANTGDRISSLSIVNKDEALAFTEKIIFNNDADAIGVDGFSVGRYSSIKNWDYYGNVNNLGGSTIGEDLGFSLFSGSFVNGRFPARSRMTFYYGIANTNTDPNVDNVIIQHGPPKKKTIYDDNDLWIQSGNETLDGFQIKTGTMNTKVMEIDDLNVSTEKGATRAIDAVKGAVEKISAQRSRIGAQQNRLEHSYANNKNTQENLENAESRIRDTYMAEEMVRLSKQNILQQTGQSMLTQCMQTSKRVLSLLD